MDVFVFIAAVLAHAPPIIFAVLGETITEKAGVINLSLDGSIMLAAMVGFAVASETGSVIAGFAVAMLAGALIALTIAFLSLTLHQPQVATGFVLTLLCRDLAFVFGNAYTGRPAVLVPHTPIPGLAGLPVIGTILFDQNPIVYLSLVAIFLAWFYISKTRLGLELRGLGERPAAAYARGLRVTLLRYLYTAAGGALVGLGGASFSLLVDPGWSRPCGFQGIGWIALAIVIFGNWQPIRASIGVYFFVTLQMLASTLQSAMPKVPTQVFPTLPFPIMILTLLLVTIGNAEWVHRVLNDLPAPVRRFVLRVLMALQTSPPAALGTVLKKE